MFPVLQEVLLVECLILIATLLYGGPPLAARDLAYQRKTLTSALTGMGLLHSL